MQNTSKQKIEKWDWLLIIGLMLAPMTGLRAIGKIGPAELLCFIWGLRYFPKKKINVKNEIFIFFSIYLISMMFGTLWCLIISPDELGVSQWPVWIFLMFIALAMYEGLNSFTYEYIEIIFKKFCKISIIWYLLMYFFSIFVRKSFLGAPLWYYSRFTGGATNPHQIAVLMCGLTFCFLRFAVKSTNFKEVAKNALYGCLCFYIVYITESSTGIAALGCGILSSLIVLSIVNINDSRFRYYFLILEFLVVLGIVIYFYDDIVSYLFSWIASDKNGVGRLELYNQIGNSFYKSPIFGLGPGVHCYDAAGNVKEYHNTYLEILASTGIVGIVTFARLTFKTIKNMFIDPWFFPILVSIYAYGLGGFAMRRLGYWGIFMFIFVLSERKKRRIYA